MRGLFLLLAEMKYVTVQTQYEYSPLFVKISNASFFSFFYILLSESEYQRAESEKNSCLVYSALNLYSHCYSLKYDGSFYVYT